MKTTSFSLSGQTVQIFLPEAFSGAAIYILSAAQTAVSPPPMLQGAAYIYISGMDWNCDLSPWPTPGVFRGAPDFSGGADAFLDHLSNCLLPAAEQAAGIQPRHRGLAGYSLAGLFAVYTACKSRLFDRIASVSGSLWYDGFVEFAAEWLSSSALERAYFSVGRKEKLTRNRRMSTVETATRKIAALLDSRGVHTRFELNEGSHFTDPEERMSRGIEFLTCDIHD